MNDPHFQLPVQPLPLIGRATQLAALDRMIAGIEGGHPLPHTLLISGEAGIGKSRLLTALRERVSARWMVLDGACFEPYQAEPYAPIVDLLSRHAAAPIVQRVTAALGSTSGALGLLPGLAQLLPLRATDAPLLDTAQNQRHILKELADLFARFATDSPLLITIEDLHWSDAATLTFLPILAHTLAGLPALLVVTYRSDEPTPALASMLAELDRRRLATEIALPRLSRSEVEALLQHALAPQQPISAPFLKSLHELTDGNPFFVEEVALALPVASWAASTTNQLPIPRSVQEAVSRRSQRLSPAARELLTLAAALGRHFDFAILQQVTGRDEDVLLEQIKELIAARLIVEQSDDQFAFHHALARAAIYSSLLARERRTLHRRLGEALEPLLGAAHAADLTHHFLLAGLWERALHYAEIAIEQAGRIYAIREMLVHQNAALEALIHLPDRPRTALLVARAAAHAMLGYFDAAQADLDAALADAQARDRPADEGRALIGLGELWTTRDYRRAGEYFARTLQHARQMEEPALLARSLNQVGIWHMNQDRPHTAYAMHAEALAIYEQLGDLGGQAETHERLGVTHLFMGDAGAGIRSLAQAAEQYGLLNNPIGQIRIAGMSHLRLYAANEALDIDAIAPPDQQAMLLLKMVQDRGLRAQEGPYLQVLASHLIWIGTYGPALAYLRESIAIGQEFGHYEWLSYALAWQSALCLALGDVAEAVRWGQRGMESAYTIASPFVLREVAYHLIRAYTAAGAFPDAHALLSTAMLPTGEQNEPSLMLRRIRLAGAELALAESAPERALAEVDDLIATAANPHGKVIPVLWCVRGEALAALNQREQASAVLEDALATASIEGRRPLALRVLTDLARLAIAQRRRDAATAALDDARLLIDELAASIAEPAVRASFRQRAYAALPTIPVVTPRQAVKQVFGGLTDRELDVARLIARGYTNRQIAEALVLSERTVGAHVGSILSKLSFSSRLQVARWAVEKGIAR